MENPIKRCIYVDFHRLKRNKMAIAIAIVVFIFVLLPLLNRIWFRASIPLDFSQNLWIGTWDSDTNWVSGRLVVLLPDPIPTKEEFDVRLLIYWDLWSLFRPGGTMRMEMTGRFDAKGAGAGDTERTAYAPPLSFSVKKGGQARGLSLDYVATIDEHSTIIAGGYQSSPFDMGHFVIKRW